MLLLFLFKRADSFGLVFILIGVLLGSWLWISEVSSELDSEDSEWSIGDLFFVLFISLLFSWVVVFPFFIKLVYQKTPKIVLFSAKDVIEFNAKLKNKVVLGLKTIFRR